MVKLINVKCEGEIASCNFYYEDDDMTPEKAGFVRVNRGEVLEYIPMVGEEGYDYSPGLNHAIRYLYKTFDMKVVPKSTEIYWY
jgi:hypothetical protein